MDVDSKFLLSLIVGLLVLIPNAFSSESFNETSSFETTQKDQVGPLIDYEIISWENSEYKFRGDAAIFTNDLSRPRILESGQEYYIVQKAEFVKSSFEDELTTVNATIGYAIQKGNHVLHSPIHENATDIELEEFMQKENKQREEFAKQSTIRNSYDFVVDIENPFYIKFPFMIDGSGQYTRQFYNITYLFEGPGRSGMGVFTVVDNFSKAVDKNGVCENNDYGHLIKHDYSTVVCVDSETARKLIERGWGLWF